MPLKLPILSIILIVICATASCASDVKDADLAGSWYPASQAELGGLLRGYMAQANPEKIDGTPFAIIVPHAGYRFSGSIAAYGFKAAAGQRIKTVILLGFSHRKGFDGVAIYDRGSFRTPLGEITVDAELARAIALGSNRITFRPSTFSEENSVEMEIPFIQIAFPGARIVPLAFGSMEYADAQAVADALAGALKGRDDYIIVASTDLSHYRTYEDANAIDKHFVDVLKDMKAKELYDEARLGVCELCGVMPVTATLLAAEKLGFDKITVLKYANSGDTFGRKENVVGYVSAVIYRPGLFSEKSGHPGPQDRDKGPVASSQGPGVEVPAEEGKAMFNDVQRKRLLQIARESMTSYVRDGKRMKVAESDPLLNQEMGAFVTLHEKGQLRGCIGNMVGRGPLCQTVAAMAIEAATGDPRFSRLSPSELDKVDIEVSVLTPLKKVSGPEEIRVPGQGVIVRKGFASGVYLPQVAAETGWSKEEFLTSLCAQKAGIDPYAWKDPATELYTFEAEVFGEKGGQK